MDTLSGGALTYYHQVLGQVLKAPLLISLFPLPGPDPSLASGDMRLTLDPFTPPGPCGPIERPRSALAVAICGLIRNPGGETFTNGVLLAPGVALRFGGDALPPSPCRQYMVKGMVAVPAGLLTQLAGDPGALTLRFHSREHPGGAIGGSLAGGPDGAPAGGAAIAAGGASSRGGACLVRFGP